MIISEFQEWSAYCYQVFLGEDERLVSPFSMSSYDHVQGRKTVTKESERKKSAGVGKRLTKEQKPKWKKMYAGYVRGGMKLNQAKRKASGILRGLTSQEARGHKEELGIIETIIEIIEPEKYIEDALFRMQKFFERVVELQLKFFFNPVQKDDKYIDYSSEFKGKNRQFEWKIFDEDGELRYYLQYEQGQITNDRLWGTKTRGQEYDWDVFPMFEFLQEVKSCKVWE